MRPAAALAVILSLTPLAAGGQDFEYARGAVERGEILPLAEVLALLHRTHPGRVIEVDLDEDDGMMIYEVELVTEDGRLIEVELDAASGRILDLDEDDED